MARILRRAANGIDDHWDLHALRDLETAARNGAPGEVDERGIDGARAHDGDQDQIGTALDLEARRTLAAGALGRTGLSDEAQFDQFGDEG